MQRSREQRHTEIKIKNIISEKTEYRKKENERILW